MSRHSRVLVVALAVVFPASAFAHSAPGSHAHGFELGLLHPLTGLDHLLAMVAIGVWAARSGPRDIWIAPAVFVTGMGIGLLTGLPVLPATGIELLVALSVAAFGLLLAFAMTLPRWATALLAAGAGLSHGAAHAAEWPAQSGLASFAIGALLTTLMLHTVGALSGLATRRLHTGILRVAGVAMMAFGFGAALTAV